MPSFALSEQVAFGWFYESGELGRYTYMFEASQAAVPQLAEPTATGSGSSTHLGRRQALRGRPRGLHSISATDMHSVDSGDDARRRIRSDEDSVEQSDVSRAALTVPRGTGPHDSGVEPAVDPAVWIAHVRFYRTHDAEHLATLVQAYESYALSLARRMNRYREPLEDLEQVAREALISSLNRFDPDRGIPFPAFATPTILGALRRHFRDRGWSVRVPRRVHEITVARHRSADRLTAALGRMPTDEEIACDLGIEVADLVRAEGASRARTTNSLDALVGPNGVPARDLIAATDQDLLSCDNRIVLGDALATLSARDRDIIGLYYAEELTQSQIAERYGVSQMQISRWLAKTITQLRVEMCSA